MFRFWRAWVGGGEGVDFNHPGMFWVCRGRGGCLLYSPWNVLGKQGCVGGGGCLLHSPWNALGQQGRGVVNFIRLRMFWVCRGRGGVVYFIHLGMCLVTRNGGRGRVVDFISVTLNGVPAGWFMLS